MSSRLSGTIKSIVNQYFDVKIKELQDKKLKRNQEIEEARNIKNLKEYKDLVKSFNIFKEAVMKQIPEYSFYSSYQDFENQRFGYVDRNDTVYVNDAQIIKYSDEIKEIEKERTLLLFNLENAPIKSDDYLNAFNTVQKILKEVLKGDD